MSGRRPHPFVGGDAAAHLYRDARRLEHRTGALHRAKTHGRPVADVIAALAHGALHRRSGELVIADVGCGRGTTTQRLAIRLHPSLLIGIDASRAMLDVASRCVGEVHSGPTRWLHADFHQLPLADRSCDLVVAAFCLYHSSRPGTVIPEIARCLRSGGIAILATKSADSYRELDELVARSGLDPTARQRPSLYVTAHSANIAELASGALRIQRLEHEQHGFTFEDLAHVADYLATSPKYQLSRHLSGDRIALAAALRARAPDRPLTTTSTITYLVGKPLT